MERGRPATAYGMPGTHLWPERVGKAGMVTAMVVTRVATMTTTLRTRTRKLTSTDPEPTPGTAPAAFHKSQTRGLQTGKAGEAVEKREPSCTAGGNVNQYSHYGEQYGGSVNKLKIELPYDPAIPLLGIYPEKTIIQKDTRTPMFTAALFTRARTRKQAKCPSTDEWIKKMWYIYTMEYSSDIKRNEIVPFAETWIDPETVIRSEVSQKEKNKYCIISLICGI